LIINKLTPLPLLFKRAEREEIARWAILAKEPACREGMGKGLRKKRAEKA
jgi:hypothetical protein